MVQKSLGFGGFLSDETPFAQTKPAAFRIHKWCLFELLVARWNRNRVVTPEMLSFRELVLLWRNTIFFSFTDSLSAGERKREGRGRERERDPFHFGTKYYLPWQTRSVASSTLSREEKSWWHRWLNQISLGRILATGMPLQWLLMRSLTLIYFQRQSCK